MLKSHGGKRAGAGRKRHNPQLKELHIRLTDTQIKLVRMWGRGDISAGLRWLIDESSKLIRRAKEKE